MQSSMTARFIHVRKYLWDVRFSPVTTLDLVCVLKCERPSGRALHTAPIVTTAFSESRSSSVHLPFWAPGSGYYGQTLGRSHRRIIESASDLILVHVDTVPVRDDGVFTVADYATNDGFTSMNLMERIIGQLRMKQGEKLPIQVLYEDQEKNDFNSLFNRLSDGTSYLSKYNNVYTFATNSNFYKQCVPDGTCDVIFTSIATHWLDNPSVNFKDGFFNYTANADSEELRRFYAEAERDWTKFLLLRARELKRGGLLIALNLGTSEDFQHATEENNREEGKRAKCPISAQGSGCVEIMVDLDTVWRQFQQEDIITQEEYETCFIPAAVRKPKEDTAPFEAANSPVVEAGLSLVYYDQVLHNFIFKDLWRENQCTEGVDDRAYFAEHIVKSFMVPLKSSFETSLSDSRSAEDKEAIVNELYKRFEERVAAKDPDTYRGDHIVNRLIARKA